METEQPALTPLPLQSPRWKSLKAHFGNAGVAADLPAVPVLLERWHRTVGTYAEEYDYIDLLESYLHQRTILDVAYAVVPHLASRLDELDPDRRRAVIDDLALVEDTRLVPDARLRAIIEDIERTSDVTLRDIIVQNTIDRHPPLPDDLSAAYLEAINRAKRIAGEAWGKATSEEPGAQHFRRHVRFLREAGCTDDDVVFGVEALTADRGACALVYELPTVAQQELCRMRDAPPGWFERTRLTAGTERGRLVFRALHSLAWLHSHLDVRSVLRTENATSSERRASREDG